jgi:dihydrodipicolinate synthase/N-acetylneuraminate lyase
MDLMGLAGGPVRPPRMDVTDAERAEIKNELERLGILQA